MGKPGASCVVQTLSAMVAVLTDGHWNAMGIRVPGYPFQYPTGTRVFKYPEVRALGRHDYFHAEKPLRVVFYVYRV